MSRRLSKSHSPFVQQRLSSRAQTQIIHVGFPSPRYTSFHCTHRIPTGHTASASHRFYWLTVMLWSRQLIPSCQPTTFGTSVYIAKKRTAQNCHNKQQKKGIISWNTKKNVGTQKERDIWDAAYIIKRGTLLKRNRESEGNHVRYKERNGVYR